MMVDDQLLQKPNKGIDLTTIYLLLTNSNNTQFSPLTQRNVAETLSLSLFYLQFEWV